VSSAAPSPLISPDLRRRLQQRYEEAARLACHQPSDFARIHELLAECVHNDPGSILYLDALFANLRRWQPKPKTAWWQRWLGGSPSAASQSSDSIPGASSTEYLVLCGAPEALSKGSNDPALLRQLATAAGACDFDEVELRYILAARDAAPDDAETLRQLAHALTRQGRFEEAGHAWSAVLARGNDPAAEQVLNDLRVSEHLAAAEARLDQLRAAAGTTLAMIQEREELRLARSQQRIEIARRRAAHDAHHKAQSLVQRFTAEHLRLQIEILHLRCERIPGDQNSRLELARRLKEAGNYSGAIQRLEETLRTESPDAQILLELGECWQHLRQFDKALDYYRQAVDQRTENMLAHYRAGVLLSAMGNHDEAAQQFAAVIAVNPAFKDAAQRLAIVTDSVRR
jgi:tetratricopeptide (TPR) repeat protein